MRDEITKKITELLARVVENEEIDEEALLKYFYQAVRVTRYEMTFPKSDRNTFKIREGLIHSISAAWILLENLKE